MKVQTTLLFVLTTISQICLGAKIAFLPQFGRSHTLVMQKLANGLQARGHKVTIIVGGEATYATNNPNAKLFKVSDEFLEQFKVEMDMMKSGVSLLSTISEYAGIIWLTWKQTWYCDLMLSDQIIADELKTADIIIGETLYPCSYLVADMLSVPHVSVHMIRHIVEVLPGVTNYPSYIPQYGARVPTNMRFLDRLTNLKVYLQNLYVREVYVFPGFEKIKIKHNIKPQKSIKETMATIDLILLEKDFTVQYPQPVPPYIRETGSFMGATAEPLPDELEKFMQSSGEDGVILVSFGSMIDSVTSDVLGMMNEAFSKLPQNVVWRLNLENFPHALSKNIKALEWLPQNDILGHNKTKLFITHTGVNGMGEALYHGIPMLCSPIFGDQFDNAAFIQDRGLGLVSRVSTKTSDQLVSDIQAILNDKRYRERSSHVSRAAKMRPRSSVDEAADLVEYVLAVGHLSHLKPRGLTMPFYQLYMLDVMCVLGVFIFIGIMAIRACFRFIYGLCRQSTMKTKTS